MHILDYIYVFVYGIPSQFRNHFYFLYIKLFHFFPFFFSCYQPEFRSRIWIFVLLLFVFGTHEKSDAAIPSALP